MIQLVKVFRSFLRVAKGASIGTLVHHFQKLIVDICVEALNRSDRVAQFRVILESLGTFDFKDSLDDSQA